MLSKNDFWPRREEWRFNNKENIVSSILDFGFYYCSFPRVERSLADFFDSIGHKRKSRPFTIAARPGIADI